MRRWIIVCTLALAASSPCHDACAQQGGTPQPIVRAIIDPSRVVVGQQTVLRIEVLAPNYLTSPPEMPSFQVRNAATRQLRSVNLNEEHGGATYAGVRFEYAIFPQEPGFYALGDQSIRIKYAAEPPATREVSVTLQRLSFEAYVPDAAAGLQPFIAASKLTAEQTIKRSSVTLKIGGAVTRTVTIKAEGTPAMLLPPQTFAAVDGFQLYPAQPALEDKTDGRTDVMTSTRTDSATYMLERGGNYSLPEIVIPWWNVESGKVEQIRLEAVAFDVEGGAAAGGATSWGWTWADLLDAVADHWVLAVLTAIVIIVAGWAAPAVARRLMRMLRHRHATYLNSEAWSFRRLRNAARKRSAGAVYFALLGWLQRFVSITRVGTIDALMSAAQDPVLEQQIATLRNELFAPEHTTVGWSPRKLIGHVRSARRTLRRRSRHDRAASALPERINPIGAPPARFSNRRVAR